MNKWNDIMQTKMHSEIDKKKHSQKIKSYQLKMFLTIVPHLNTLYFLPKKSRSFFTKTFNKNAQKIKFFRTQKYYYLEISNKLNTYQQFHDKKVSLLKLDILSLAYSLCENQPHLGVRGRIQGLPFSIPQGKEGKR